MVEQLHLFLLEELVPRQAVRQTEWRPVTTVDGMQFAPSLLHFIFFVGHLRMGHRVTRTVEGWSVMERDMLHQMRVQLETSSVLINHQ